MSEKMDMINKTIGLSIFSIMSGFLLGFGACVLILAIAFSKIPGIIIGSAIIIASFIIALIGDKIRKEVIDYITKG